VTAEFRQDSGSASIQLGAAVRWGIIGCGNVTEVKSGPAFRRVEGSELRAVMRRNAAAAEDYARRHAVPVWYSDARKLIGDADVNAVYIATPPDTHAFYCKMAAEAGKPVYVEKPMARNYDECMAMTELCEQNAVPLYVAYYRRALPRFNRVKQILDEGGIGRPAAVQTLFSRKLRVSDSSPDNWRVNPQIAGCGYFCDLASHHIDLMLQYFGLPLQIQGIYGRQAAAYEAEDAVSYQMEMKNGLQISAVWNFAAFRDIDQTHIIGDRGEISFSTFADAPVILRTERGTETFNIRHPEHIQEPMIRNVVRSLQGLEAETVSGREAAKTSFIMDALLGRRPYTPESLS